MASRKQIRANRRNARRSTGPKTAAGKAASAANALRHGLSAADTVVLPDEDVEAFEEMQRGVLADLDPKDTLQTVLAQRIVVLLWRLDRVARLEAELFVHGTLEWRSDRLSVAGRRGAVRGALVRMQREGHESADAFREVMEETDRVDDDIQDEILRRAPSARTLVERDESGKAFDRLARHEGALQRALHRTLEELGRRRRAWRRQATGDPDFGPSRFEGTEPPWEGDVPDEGEADALAAQAGENGFLQNEANSAQALDAAASSPRSPASPSVADSPEILTTGPPASWGTLPAP